MKKYIITLFLLLLAVQISAEEDVLEKILSEVGFSQDDIGYQPKGYWNRFPLDIPHKLSSFDDLFAEPLKLYDYSKVMANTVEFYMDPVYADSNYDALYKLVYNLGVDKKQGGFRSYSANLIPAPDGDNKLIKALDYLYAIDGQQSDYMTFGQIADYPEYKHLIAENDSLIPDTIETILAELIVNLGEAVRWRNIALRNCNKDDMEKIFSIKDLANTQTDGTVYYPEMDDLEAAIDKQSLHYAALKVAAASEKAELELQKVKDQIQDEFELNLVTPFGKIVLMSKDFMNKNVRGARKLLNIDEAFLIVDFGNDNDYYGPAGATASVNNPVSVVIDLGGFDFYGNQVGIDKPHSGSGILGVGLVLDSDGDDNYKGKTYAQGFGMFGIGILYDRCGNDSYESELSSQGCGYFGIGLCFDVLGDDSYKIFASGQGMGGVGGGVGVCASFEGNDIYYAEPYSEVYNRGDYHSGHKINGNEVQGCGMGRRGDGSDGHSWAGGLGAIIDIHGNDLYHSGNWSLGIGYWFGTGIAIDIDGDDIYKSCYFTQGSGAHFCNGILIDEGGNDKHELFETAGAALGFGWDYTNAFLINKGGDDIYRAKMISIGLAQIRSCAFLIDIGGNDNYYLGKGTPGLGEATFRNDYKEPSQLTPYYYYAKSFGGFIDIGGIDNYYEFDKDSGEETLHPTAKENSLWFQPEKSDSTFGANNFGVGIDIESGSIFNFFKWDK